MPSPVGAPVLGMRPYCCDVKKDGGCACDCDIGVCPKAIGETTKSLKLKLTGPELALWLLLLLLVVGESMPPFLGLMAGDKKLDDEQVSCELTCIDWKAELDAATSMLRPASCMGLNDD